MGKQESQKGEWTQAALEAKALEKSALRERIRNAIAFCNREKIGAKRAVKEYGESEAWQGVEWYHIQNGQRGKLKWLNDRCKYDILTDREGQRLEEWLLASAANCAPAKEQRGDGLHEVTDKIVTLLKAWMVANKKFHHSVKLGAVLLTPAEQRLVTVNGAHVSQVWWAHYRAKYPKVQVKKANSDDDKRVKKRTEAVLERHFNGEYGLRAELLDAGIMDPETEEFDPSRLLWLDELGQFVDYNSVGKRETAIGERGKRLRRSDKVNREVLSVLNTHGADGFQYGVQVNAARKGFTQAMVDCWETPDWAPSFDDTIFELDKKSCSMLISTSEKGSQTAKTFLELLEDLDRQITARSDAREKMGLPRIARPVVLGSDNHNSRFGAEVISAATANESRLGIRLFLEESNVSGFLQWPDQLNHQFHGAYNKAKKEYKLCHKRIYGEEPDIGIPEALEIIGGCKEFNLQGMWFHWTTAANIIAACRKVSLPPR